MAKAKTTNEKKSAKGKENGKSTSSETLSEFQTPATGRTDPSLNGNGHKSAPNGKDSLTITKVKLVKKEFLSIDYTRIEPDATTASDSYENKMRPVHPDCRAAFKALAIHLALLCDYISTKQIKEIDKYDPVHSEKFNVTGVSIGGGEGEEGVVLTGHKITAKGKAVILNSPFTRFEEADDTAYRYVDDLRAKVDAVINEAKAYMDGKRGEDPQGKLEFEEEPYAEIDK